GARPFSTLNVVLRDLSSGNLDQAILWLRDGIHQPWMGDKGRTSALAHAVMALMLDMKSTAVGSQGGQDEVITALRDDARSEAVLARKADQAFQPAKGLFTNPLLQHRLEALLHEAAAG